MYILWSLNITLKILASVKSKNSIIPLRFFHTNFNRSLEVKANAVGWQNEVIASCYMNLGSLEFYLRKDYAKAENYTRQAIEILEVGHQNAVFMVTCIVSFVIFRILCIVLYHFCCLAYKISLTRSVV